jgi:serine/threonine protein kinase
LQPANIFINEDLRIIIGDLSFCRYTLQKCNYTEESTEFVVSKWYKAPEEILGGQALSNAVDIWGIGCILAELFVNKPIFQGNTIID